MTQSLLSFILKRRKGLQQRSKTGGSQVPSTFSILSDMKTPTFRVSEIKWGEILKLNESVEDQLITLVGELPDKAPVSQ